MYVGTKERAGLVVAACGLVVAGVFVYDSISKNGSGGGSGEGLTEAQESIFVREAQSVMRPIHDLDGFISQADKVCGSDRSAFLSTVQDVLRSGVEDDIHATASAVYSVCRHYEAQYLKAEERAMEGGYYPRIQDDNLKTYLIDKADGVNRYDDPHEEEPVDY